MSDDCKISDTIPDGWESLDIGPKTRERYKKILSTAKTVVWNGPLGVFERDAYAQGTRAIADYLASLKDVTVIIGGGDTSVLVERKHLAHKFTFVSTAGGATLDFLAEGTLPGIKALK